MLLCGYEIDPCLSRRRLDVSAVDIRTVQTPSCVSLSVRPFGPLIESINIHIGLLNDHVWAMPVTEQASGFACHLVVSSQRRRRISEPPVESRSTLDFLRSSSDNLIIIYVYTYIYYGISPAIRFQSRFLIFIPALQLWATGSLWQRQARAKGTGRGINTHSYSITTHNSPNSAQKKLWLNESRHWQHVISNVILHIETTLWRYLMHCEGFVVFDPLNLPEVVYTFIEYSGCLCIYQQIKTQLIAKYCKRTWAHDEDGAFSTNHFNVDIINPTPQHQSVLSVFTFETFSFRRRSHVYV